MLTFADDGVRMFDGKTNGLIVCKSHIQSCNNIFKANLKIAFLSSTTVVLAFSSAYTKVMIIIHWNLESNSLNLTMMRCFVVDCSCSVGHLIPCQWNNSQLRVIL